MIVYSLRLPFASPQHVSYQVTRRSLAFLPGEDIMPMISVDMPMISVSNAICHAPGISPRCAETSTAQGVKACMPTSKAVCCVRGCMPRGLWSEPCQFSELQGAHRRCGRLPRSQSHRRCRQMVLDLRVRVPQPSGPAVQPGRADPATASGTARRLGRFWSRVVH